MRLLKTLMAVSAVSLLAVAPAAAVQINEIRIDEPGSDLHEYVELIGTPGESLDGLTYVVIGDGSGGSGVIETDGVVALSGVIPANGIFLIAEDNLWSPDVDMVAALGFENGDNVTHMIVSGFTGAVADDLDVDDDCVLDVTPWSAIIDEVSLIKEVNPPTTTECHYASALVGPDGAFVPGHAYRCGSDWFVGPFAYPTDDTPGQGNTNCPVTTRDESWGSVKSRF